MHLLTTMPRKQCYWTRKLELDLVEFVKQREFIWKPVGNTNHDIQMKYKAYAGFAALLNRGFTARSVRDRWVNIRSTFNHYLRRLEKSKQKANMPSEVYVPSWPLWRPLQFLLTKRDEAAHNFDGYLSSLQGNQETPSPNVKVEVRSDFEDTLALRQRSQRTNQPRAHNCDGNLSSLQGSKATTSPNVKEELPFDFEDTISLALRQRSQRTDRPRLCKPLSKLKQIKKNSNCKKVLDNLILTMRPLKEAVSREEMHYRSYWFFGKHVTERLNALSPHIAESAATDIMSLLEYWNLKPGHDTPT